MIKLRLKNTFSKSKYLIHEIVISDKVSRGKKGFTQFIGCKGNDNINTIYIYIYIYMLPKLKGILMVWVKLNICHS